MHSCINIKAKTQLLSPLYVYIRIENTIKTRWDELAVRVYPLCEQEDEEEIL